MQLLNKASFNFLLRHPWQLSLALLGIMLGVAVVVSIDLALNSALNAFSETTKALTGQVSHRLLNSAGQIDETLYTRLRVKHGIDKLAPVVSGYVQMADRPDVTLKVHGIDIITEAALQSDWQRQNTADNSLRLVTEPGTVMLSKVTADKLGLKMGDAFTVMHNHTPHTLTLIAWLADDKDVDSRLLQNILLTDIGSAQIMLAMTGKLSWIDVLAKNGQSDRIERIRKVLPPETILQSVEDNSKHLQNITTAFSLNVTAMGMLSLLVGIFLIYNTMTFLVLQRRELLGRLRALGVTRPQIFRLIWTEALLIGVLGTVFGIGLGIVLAHTLLHLIAGTVNQFYFHLDQTVLLLESRQILKAALLGIGATLIAGLAPAREATRQPARLTMLRSPEETNIIRVIRNTAILAILCLAFGIVLILSTDKEVLPALFSIFLIQFGFALLTPVVMRSLMQFFAHIQRQCHAITPKLPPRLVAREISRTGPAVATLMIAISAAVAMDLMIGSFRNNVESWLRTSLTADFYIAVNPDQGNDSAQQSQHLLAQIRHLKGVAAVTTVRRRHVFVGESSTPLTVMQLNAPARRGFRVIQAEPDHWRRFETVDSVLVTEPYAYLNEVKTGDVLSLRTPAGIKDFRIIGIYKDYSGDRGHLAMSRTVYQQYWPDEHLSGIGIYANATADLTMLESRINSILQPNQRIRSNRAIFQTSMQMFDRAFKITETLRWLAALIAFIGVFGSLMALQFERTRMLGVLRAIGMTRRQIGRLITTETGLMGLTAGLFALPAGLITAYLLVTVIYQRSFGWQLGLQVHFSPLVQGLLLALTAALLAGIFPALKMARIHPAEALRNE